MFFQFFSRKPPRHGPRPPRIAFLFLHLNRSSPQEADVAGDRSLQGNSDFFLLISGARPVPHLFPVALNVRQRDPLNRPPFENVPVAVHLAPGCVRAMFFFAESHLLCVEGELAECLLFFLNCAGRSAGSPFPLRLPHNQVPVNSQAACTGMFASATPILYFLGTAHRAFGAAVVGATLFWTRESAKLDHGAPPFQTALHLSECIQQFCPPDKMQRTPPSTNFSLQFAADSKSSFHVPASFRGPQLSRFRWRTPGKAAALSDASNRHTRLTGVPFICGTNDLPPRGSPNKTGHLPSFSMLRSSCPPTVTRRTLSPSQSKTFFPLTRNFLLQLKDCKQSPGDAGRRWHFSLMASFRGGVWLSGVFSTASR